MVDHKKYRWDRFKAWALPMHFSDAVMLLLTAFIALGTLVSAVAISLQWREMIGGGKQTRDIVKASEGIQQALDKYNSNGQDALKQTFAKNDDALQRTLAQGNIALERTLAQSKQAMDYSSRQNGAAVDTAMANAQSEQRAWMGPVTITLLNRNTDWSEAHWAIVIANFGKSPALDVETYTSAGIYGKSFPSNPRYQPVDKNEEKSKQAVFPNIPLTYLADAILIESTKAFQLKLLHDKTLWYYAFGTICYADVFHRKRWSRFCWRIDIDNPTMPNQPCDTYNDTDDGQNSDCPTPMD
jgi:hypothetical protein